MKKVIIPCLICVVGLLYAQTPTNKYHKIKINGIEHETNGIDTICIVDTMPEFPGGKEKCFQFISSHLRYPESAWKDRVEGTVIIRFVVYKTGKITNVTIVKGVREDLDNEAIRVLSLMPKWKPAMKTGQPISMKYTIPIKFGLPRE